MVIINAREQAKRLNAHLHRKATKHPDAKDPAARKDHRLRFQHDRDRIVWSSAFKRLAHKTQVFPEQYGDHHRRRLTHSLEVMQLATSIARTLGLNELLCEAIALAHDLGHTPFGHAGEEALNSALGQIEMHCTKPLRGLNSYTHYEQGLDVANYIEPRYRDARKAGLDLTPHTQEGILKHTFYHDAADKTPASLRTLIGCTKHGSIKKGSGTLESQTVRIADKLSYMVSDIEDGLRIGAIHLNDLLEQDLFRGLILATLKKASSYETVRVRDLRDDRVFAEIRNRVITDLVKSVLRHASKYMDGYRRAMGIIVRPGDKAWQSMSHVYEELQRRYLFKHFLVIQANDRAKQIVSCLLCQYLHNPELIPWSFRARYINDTGLRQKVCRLYMPCAVDSYDLRAHLDLRKWQLALHDSFGCTLTFPEVEHRKVIDIVCAKDFVAGMTDNYAEQRFRQDVLCPGCALAWQRLERDKPKLRPM